MVPYHEPSKPIQQVHLVHRIYGQHTDKLIPKAVPTIEDELVVHVFLDVDLGESGHGGD